MTLENFIQQNYKEIDEYIYTIAPNNPYLQGKDADEEREEWILNDESLYNWALSEGVDI